MSDTGESQQSAPPEAQQADPSAPNPDADPRALQTRVAALEQQLEQLTTRHAALSTEHLTALRRALLAEHTGQVVPELVAGATAEELEASVETARAAFQRATEAARQQLQHQYVPAGNAARDAADLAGLTPTEKIARGLASR